MTKMAKILVADDIKQNVKLLRVILTAANYEVIEAYDGEDALEKAKSEKPDLILLDIMMPKITGYEVCKNLRADDDTKHIPIVMITALHEIDDRIRGIEAGADDFISKPFNKTELLARIKSLLRTRSITTEPLILDEILSDLIEGIIVANGQWKIKNINQTAKELLNIQDSDLQKDLLTILLEKNLSVPVDTIANAKEKFTNFQIFASNTQPSINIRGKITRVFNEDGNINKIILVLKIDG